MKNKTKNLLKQIIGWIINLINFLFVAFFIILTFISIFNKDLIIKILGWIEIIIQDLGNWNYLIAFLSSLIETFPVIGVVLPGQNIMLLVATFFAKQSYLSLIGVYIVAIIGAILGNFIGYVLGRYYGDSFFKKFGVWFGIGVTEVKYLKKGINKWGPIGITFGKFHNLTRAFLPFIAGSMGMKKASFTFYNILGSIIRAVTIVTLGSVFGKYYEIIIEYIGTIMLIILAFVGFYIYKFKKKEFKEYIKEKSEELDKL